MLVADILKRKGSRVTMVPSDMTVSDCAQRLRDERIGALVVSGDGRVIAGIISERDITYGFATHGALIDKLRVRDLMTKAVITCGPRDNIQDVMRTMTNKRIRHLPVVDGDALVGIVTSGDVLKYRLEEVQLEAAVLRDTVIAAR